jgi:hypothetical protein
MVVSMHESSVLNRRTVTYYIADAKRASAGRTSGCVSLQPSRALMILRPLLQTRLNGKCEKSQIEQEIRGSSPS